MRPYVLGGMKRAQGHRDTPYGRIEAAWTAEDGVFRLRLTVPANTRADCLLPIRSGLTVMADKERVMVECAQTEGRAVFTLGAGRYVIEGKM